MSAHAAPAVVFRTLLTILAVPWATWGCGVQPRPEPGHAEETREAQIVGAWEARTYHLAGGVTHPVEGRIFFTERDWHVLFFVMDDAGAPRRGSGEGGGYRLQGDSLTLTHLFNLSAGEAMEGLDASQLAMTVRAEAEAPEEPTRIEVTDTHLTLHFPSGNRMTFARR